MSIKITSNGRIFDIFNYTFLIIVTFLCLFPIIHVLALSFSSSTAAATGMVKLWPVGFNLKSYAYAIEKPEFITSFGISLQRVVAGAAINMFLTILAAYALSKEKKEFPMRDIYAWFFFITILFSGGLIPWYMTVKAVGLIDKIWALIIPGAVPVFNVIILLNFFRQLPKEINESAFIDGAGHWTVLWKIFVPLSTPALATILLFTSVSHWNSWFDGLIFMNSPKNYPLQSYLQTVVIQRNFSSFANATKEELETLSIISDRTTKAAQIFIAVFPILCIYPFLQKYFTKGIVLGSVKG